MRLSTTRQALPGGKCQGGGVFVSRGGSMDTVLGRRPGKSAEEPLGRRDGAEVRVRRFWNGNKVDQALFETERFPARHMQARDLQQRCASCDVEEDEVCPRRLCGAQL